MTSADKALKIVYEGMVSEQLNTETNPLYNAIKTTNKNIVGKEVHKLAPYGLNGGVSAGSEAGSLPQSAGNQYEKFITSTKNLYGSIAITDKSIEASKNNAGAFVSLLESEMKGLLKAAKFNYSRMLYGNGSGILATCAVNNDVTLVTVDSVKYLIEGLVIDILASDGTPKYQKRRILAMDRANKKILITGTTVTTTATDIITVQDSYNMEITGLDAIFKETGILYGVDRGVQYWMIPTMVNNVGAISDVKMQKPIDDLDEIAGSAIDYISCASGVRRAYYEYLETTKRNVNAMDLKGGFKAISYNGIPLVSDKHAPVGTMDFLNTKEFEMNELSDWHWMDRDGSVLKKVSGQPIWEANLVAYKELMCNKPIGQARLRGITEA